MRRSDAKQYVFDEETGKFDYIGTRYQVTSTEGDFLRLKRVGLAISIVILACFLACGLFTYGGMSSNYVLTPYVMLLIPAAWMASRFIKLWNKKMTLTEAGNRLLMHIRWSSLASAALGGVAGAAQVVYGLLNGWTQGDAAFIALMWLCVPLGAAAFVLVRRCPAEKQIIDVSDEVQDQ